MEDGVLYSQSSLLTVPQDVSAGYIQGIYPAIAVSTGDHFLATIGCQTTATNCYAKFKLSYQIDANPVVNLATYTERYEGLTRNIDVDLSSLNGQNVKFIIIVQDDTTTPATGASQRAVWIAPRVSH